MPETTCRMMRGGMIMTKGGMIKPLRRKLGLGALLLDGESQRFSGIQSPDPINLTSGRGLKTDVSRLTEKLEKLTLMKPKNVKKNIRVNL